MARCRMLLQENEGLGKMIASGRTAKLEGEIALQKTLVTEMKKNQEGMSRLRLKLVLVLLTAVVNYVAIVSFCFRTINNLYTPVHGSK